MVEHLKLKDLRSYDEVYATPEQRQAARDELSWWVIGFWAVAAVICASSLFGLIVAAVWLYGKLLQW